MSDEDPTSWPNLPPGTKSRFLLINGLRMHILEAFPQAASAETKPPLVVLLHGFPELAYSWRKVIGPLRNAGYHVVAPDQRGYGRTTSILGPAPTTYDDSLAPFQMTNIVKDVVALVYALGYTSAASVTVVGHDFGAPVAGYCALIRPDLFKRVVIMSAPFTGAPKPSPGIRETAPESMDAKMQILADELASLDPPRKHYTHYFSADGANEEMFEGLRGFLREYYHVKSADWAANHPLPAPLALQGTDPGSIAHALATLPEYYVMPLWASMPNTTAQLTADNKPGAAKWLTDAELAVYVAEYSRTSFQGGLNWYRIKNSAAYADEDCALFYGKQITVPAMFIAGRQDWGTYQLPKAVDIMRERVCTSMEDFVLVEGAGHWVQQERPEEVVTQLLRFLSKK
ncbi:Epoxide hydrolase hydrolase [Mycena kentingensis (nom. inval.)]|nr:Epoxide hydrolase hydrolase [Mycena kentingensis (nom. inval.)]